MLNLQTIDLKKEIKELIKNDPGKARGDSIKFLVNYVRQKQGEKGLKRVTTELKRCGYELPDIERIGNIDWIPSSLPTIFMLASAKIFNWQEEDIIETGREIASVSSVTKLFIRYFLSLEKTFKLGTHNWGKFYTFGEINLVECDSNKKRVVARLKNYKRHPIICLHLKGVFSKIIEIATGGKNIAIKETKCEFRGDPYHEFVLRWE